MAIRERIANFIDPGRESMRQDYTEAVTDALVNAAGDYVAYTGALEACAGLYARSAMRAAVGGRDARLFTPMVMATIFRDLIQRGESCFLTSNPMLYLPSFDCWHNGSQRMVSYQGINGERVSVSDALHMRYSVDWWLAERGISPLGRARQLRNMAGNVEKHLAQELGRVHGHSRAASA